MLPTQAPSLSRCSPTRACGYIFRRKRVTSVRCNRSRSFTSVAQHGRTPARTVPDEKEISSYTSDSVSAIRNAAKGLDAPFHLSGHIRLQQPLELLWQGSGRSYSTRLPGKFLYTREMKETDLCRCKVLVGLALILTVCSGADWELDNLHGMCIQAVFGRGGEKVSMQLPSLRSCT